MRLQVTKSIMSSPKTHIRTTSATIIPIIQAEGYVVVNELAKIAKEQAIQIHVSELRDKAIFSGQAINALKKIIGTMNAAIECTQRLLDVWQISWKTTTNTHATIIRVNSEA